MPARRVGDVGSPKEFGNDSGTSGVSMGIGMGMDVASRIATDVDAPAAAIRERARAALLVACDGWRQWRRCTDPDGSRVAHPHPECLAAQYRYELILLENGIPR